MMRGLALYRLHDAARREVRRGTQQKVYHSDGGSGLGGDFPPNDVVNRICLLGGALETQEEAQHRDPRSGGRFHVASLPESTCAGVADCGPMPA